jgi:hypothetical protein
MSVSLNKDIRENICADVITHGFKDDLIAFAAATEALKADVYSRLYSPETRLLITALGSAAEQIKGDSEAGWAIAAFQDRDSFGLHVAGYFSNVGRPGRHSSNEHLRRALSHLPVGTLPESVRYSMMHSHASGNILFLDAGDELGQRVTALELTRVDLNQRIKRRSIEILTVLSSARNDRQLEMIWPDVMPIARPFLVAPEPKVQLPATVISTLNEALGLPAPVVEGVREMEMA